MALAFGDALHLHKQGAAGLCGQAVMAENNTRPLGQRRHRGEQRSPHALIGHQPERGERGGVAFVHWASYSGGMSEDAKLRLDALRAAIAAAAKVSGRPAQDVTLIAVSKTHSAAAIRPLLDAGHRVYGENRVQEAADKWPALKAAYPDIELHLVGQLQSNKAEEAVALFDVIHSVDRPSLVTALARASQKLGRRPRCFVQVNIGGETQKGGCTGSDLPTLLEQAQNEGLDVTGLMAVPPADVEAAPYFALLAKLARDHGLSGLSMGMSGDFETAIMIGATHIRVGSALFGVRCG